LLLVENTMPPRNRGIRLNDIANGPGAVDEDRDNEAGILIAVSLSHPVSKLEL
jgi:hypothetical protein